MSFLFPHTLIFFALRTLKIHIEGFLTIIFRLIFNLFYFQNDIEMIYLKNKYPIFAIITLFLNILDSERL